LNYRKIQGKQKRHEVSILTPVLPDYKDDDGTRQLWLNLSAVS